MELHRKCSEDKTPLLLWEYVTYLPLDWRLKLGPLQFRRYAKFLIEFTIILEVTHRAKTSILYEKYFQIRNDRYPKVFDDFQEILNMPVSSPPFDLTTESELGIVRVQPKQTPPPGQRPPPAKRTPLGPGVPPNYHRDSSTVKSHRDEELQDAHRRLRDESPNPAIENAPVYVQSSVTHLAGNHPVGIYGADPVGIDIAIPEADPFFTKENQSMSSKTKSRSSDRYYDYNPYAPELNDKDMKLDLQSFGNPISVRLASVSASQKDRYEQYKPHKIRAKFDKISWDGMNISFAKFKRILGEYLIQVGAGYLLDAAFLQNYLILGHD